MEIWGNHSQIIETQYFMIHIYIKLQGLVVKTVYIIMIFLKSGFYTANTIFAYVNLMGTTKERKWLLLTKMAFSNENEFGDTKTTYIYIYPIHYMCAF